MIALAGPCTGVMAQVPWVPEVFLARFPVSVNISTVIHAQRRPPAVTLRKHAMRKPLVPRVWLGRHERQIDLPFNQLVESLASANSRNGKKISSFLYRLINRSSDTFVFRRILNAEENYMFGIKDHILHFFTG